MGGVMLNSLIKTKMYGALCPLNSNLGLHKVAPLLKSKYLNVI